MLNAKKKNAKIRLGDVYPRAQEKYTAKKKKKMGGRFFPKEDRQTDTLERSKQILLPKVSSRQI